MGEGSRNRHVEGGQLHVNTVLKKQFRINKGKIRFLNLGNNFKITGILDDEKGASRTGEFAFLDIFGDNYAVKWSVNLGKVQIDLNKLNLRLCLTDFCLELLNGRKAAFEFRLFLVKKAFRYGFFLKK